MKNWQLHLSSFLFITLLFTSCNRKDTGIHIECDEPTNFEIVNYTNQTQVDLAWEENDAVDNWQIEYGLIGFSQSEGMIVETESNEKTILGLDFNQAYDFYLRAQCGDGFSDWVGPISNTPEEVLQSHALMTANIKGVQYDYMVPFLWQTFINEAVSIVTFSDNEELYLKIQGNSEPQNSNFDTNKEINIFIPETNWELGTYNLGNDYIDTEENPQAFVNLVYFDSAQGTFQANEGEFGSITITEFNLEERIIKGTFEFTFTLYDVNTNIETGPFDCLDGTFDYSLDDTYFD
ncbi:MAG: fibronectin type III domain-containing protein [Flavobacteriales bacterium]